MSRNLAATRAFPMGGGLPLDVVFSRRTVAAWLHGQKAGQNTHGNGRNSNNRNSNNNSTNSIRSNHDSRYNDSNTFNSKIMITIVRKVLIVAKLGTHPALHSSSQPTRDGSKVHLSMFQRRK